MKPLRMEGKLDLCISHIYDVDQTAMKICFLNPRSLHKHISDVRADSKYLSTNVRKYLFETMYGIPSQKIGLCSEQE